MNRFAILAATILLSVSCSHKATGPFGWAVCSGPEGGEYRLTGGSRDAHKGVAGTSVTLKSTGSDMRDAIVSALAENDIVILDGSDGVFPISSTMVIDGLKNKTVVGVNGAVLRSVAQTTPELLSYMDANKGKYLDDLPDEEGLYHMPFGSFASKNLQAYASRRAMYDFTGDADEKLCHSGMFFFDAGSENIIVRNIAFEGTGTFRGLAENMIRISNASSHIWLDHCSMTDPSRCCISCSGGADFITISRCILRYTERSGNHTLGFLISSSDNQPQDVGHLHITLAGCMFDHVWSRLPMGRYGRIHVLNNYYDCPGSVGINPRTESAFLVEGNYFEDGTKAFCRYRIDVNPPAACQWKDNRYGTDDPVEDIGEVCVPYEYQALPAMSVKDEILADVGPVLSEPLVF